MGVITEVRFLKRHKADGPDGLSPLFFKDDGEVLVSKLLKFVGSVRSRKEIPEDWYRSKIRLTYNKGGRPSYENHRALNPSSLRALSSIVYPVLERDACMRSKPVSLPVVDVPVKLSLYDRL